MSTLYIQFKNKEEIEIPNVTKEDLMASVREMPPQVNIWYFSTGTAVNIREINYMEVIENEE